MQIIEQSLIPKNPRKKSEDGIVVTPDFVAVIDGSTSKTTRRYHPLRSNGECAMRVIASYIRRMSPRNSCHQFCVGATHAIQKVYTPLWKPNKADIIARLKEHPEERLCASAVIFSRLRREIWMVGDCQCLVNGQLYENPKPYENILAQQRADEINRLLSQGTTVDQLRREDIARPTIIPHMLQAMQGQNHDYSVIDGFPIPERHVPVITLTLQPFELVLASDGYPFLLPTLAESEAALQQQLTEDPLNIGRFKATKGCMEGNNSFDDRAYIRLKV
jgi:glycerophosphoryl diester phosphodiesterase